MLQGGKIPDRYFTFYMQKIQNEVHRMKRVLVSPISNEVGLNHFR